MKKIDEVFRSRLSNHGVQLSEESLAHMKSLIQERNKKRFRNRLIGLILIGAVSATGIAFIQFGNKAESEDDKLVNMDITQITQLKQNSTLSQQLPTQTTVEYSDTRNNLSSFSESVLANLPTSDEQDAAIDDQSIGLNNYTASQIDIDAVEMSTFSITDQEDTTTLIKNSDIEFNKDTFQAIIAEEATNSSHDYDFQLRFGLQIQGAIQLNNSTTLESYGHSPLLSNGFGLRTEIGYNKTGILLGVEFKQLNQSIDFTFSDSYETTNFPFTHRVESNNRSTYLAFPVMAFYETDLNRFIIGSSAGVTINKLMQAEGAGLLVNGSEVEVKELSNISRSSFIQYSGSVRAAYQIDSRWFIYCNTKFDFGRPFQSNASNGTVLFGGLLVGIKINFEN
ncbi:MAG: hypothetical protein JXR19_10540 [Bacteroidia bacterium]